MENMELLLAEHEPDIVSVVEHWCDQENVKTMTIPGYIQADSYCRPNRAHGGSMIYVKTGLQTKNLFVSRFSEEMECEISGTIVTVHNIRMSVLSVYRPCSGNVEIFLDRISLALDHCYNSADRFFLCGDLNIDFFKSKCLNRKLLFDLFECYYLPITSNTP